MLTSLLNALLPAAAFIASTYLLNAYVIFLIASSTREITGLTGIGDNTLHDMGWGGYTSYQAKRYLVTLCNTGAESDQSHGTSPQFLNRKLVRSRLEMYCRVVSAFGLVNVIYALALVPLVLWEVASPPSILLYFFVIALIVTYLVCGLIESNRLREATIWFKRAHGNRETPLENEWRVGRIGSSDNNVRRFHRAATFASMMTVLRYWSCVFLLILSVLFRLG